MSKTLCFLSLIVLSPKAALGWLEPQPPHDPNLVQISQCIVIGHAKDASTNHPILVITGILKGNPPEEIPINVSDRLLRSPSSSNLPGFVHGLTIWEGGDMGHPICDDIRKNQIWFLRPSPTKSNETGRDELAVMEPGDIQPLKLKTYYLALLSPDPVGSLNLFKTGDSEIELRARGSLDYLALQRIEKISDPRQRVDQLIPYYLAANGDPGNIRNEAMAQIERCGTIGAEKMQSIFFDIKPSWEQVMIMAFWQQVNFRDSLPTLRELLHREDLFWSTQNMQDRSWYPNQPGDISVAKNDSFNKILYAVTTLNVLAKEDDQTKSAVEMIRKRWESSDPTGNHELIRACDQFLQRPK